MQCQGTDRPAGRGAGTDTGSITAMELATLQRAGATGRARHHRYQPTPPSPWPRSTRLGQKSQHRSVLPARAGWRGSVPMRLPSGAAGRQQRGDKVPWCSSKAQAAPGNVPSQTSSHPPRLLPLPAAWGHALCKRMQFQLAARTHLQALQKGCPGPEPHSELLPEVTRDSKLAATGRGKGCWYAKLN